MQNLSQPGIVLPGNFFLVGLMGAGKTTIGRALARIANKQFLDSDHEIEVRTGVRIPVIFDIEGEQGFRERECEVIKILAGMSEIVLATGGGAILAKQNREILQSSGFVIYLHATPADLYERTRHDKNRPLLQTDNPLEKLQDLYLQRDGLYREIADLVIDTSKQSVNSLAANLSRILLEQKCAKLKLI